MVEYLPCACGRTGRLAEKFNHREIRRIKREAGTSEVLAYIEELEGLWAYAERQGNVWRGIASAMGYEPEVHDKVKPKSPWLLARVAKYRAASAMSAGTAATTQIDAGPQPASAVPEADAHD